MSARLLHNSIHCQVVIIDTQAPNVIDSQGAFCGIGDVRA